MRDARSRLSGTLVVGVVVAVVLATAGGLIWYKRRPQLRTLPFTLATSTGTMFLVPAGRVLQGPRNEESIVPAFYIDRIEVTNEQYRRFAEAEAYPLPPAFPAESPELPVANVTIVDATAFCKWAGKRLPDPIEWEKAARGSRGAKFPWGDDADASRANVADNPEFRGLRLLPADSMPQHISPSRAQHMVGNVAEYVRTTYRPTSDQVATFQSLMSPPPRPNEPWYTVRGGSYLTTLADSAPWLARPAPVRWFAPDIGFRCAKDPER
jgi:formylglycine-generating enzyme required for sulfatase activity